MSGAGRNGPGLRGEGTGSDVGSNLFGWGVVMLAVIVGVAIVMLSVVAMIVSATCRVIEVSVSTSHLDDVSLRVGKPLPWRVWGARHRLGTSRFREKSKLTF